MVARLIVLWLFGLLSLPSISISSPSLEARADRQLMREDETVNFELIQRDQDTEPDISPLLGDFDVLSRSRNNQVTIVNNAFDSYTLWKYVLAPKRTGLLTIPAIVNGGVQSQAISIRVEAVSAGNPMQRDIFLEVSVDNPKPYVHSQIIYSVKIFHARDFFDASLSEPDVADAIQQRLGEDSRYNVMRNGIDYKVIERRYVLFAQKSGHLEIPALVLSATVPDNNAQGYLGGVPGRQGRTIRVRSEHLTLDVQAVVPQFTGQWWLPARAFTLSERWSNATPELRVGEPVTRTITMQALGVVRGQLPLLPQPKVDGLKIYTDKPTLDEKVTPQGLLGSHTESWAIVPSAAGQYTLPAINVSWWDAVNDQAMTASLPERTINVLAAAPVPASPTPAAGDETPNETVLLPATATGLFQQAMFLWWGLVLASIGWALTALILWWKLHRLSQQVPTTTSRAASKSKAPTLKQLQTVLRRWRGG